MVFQTVIGGYSSLELVSWANGTPAQLAAMLDAHYAGRINIANYWSVGDSRTVSIDAIAANSCTGAMSAQTAQLVLMNFGGKTLVTAEHGKTNCACVVGFKNCLNAKGIWYESGGSTKRYSESYARTFLNNQLYLSFPSDMRTLFKSFVNKTTEFGSFESTGTLVTTEDLLALPAPIEVTGSNPYGVVAGEGSIFTYYNTTANRTKTVSGTVSPYWTRSAGSYSTVYYMSTTAYAQTGSPNYDYGISPFGVI